MSTKVIINMKTTVHKKSSGKAPCYPDTCKTPTPGGPTPIPYPNVSQSSMSGKTTKKVKVDKKGANVEGAYFSLSSGDEAGSAGGSVISNKIKGKSYFKNFSMDVKLEKKKVARLGDPKLSNCGSNGWPQPAEVQPPAKGGRHGDQASCDALEEKRIKPEDRDEELRKHGMDPKHGEAISSACQQTGKSCTVRQGNKDCVDKIGKGFNGKPASAEGDTLSTVMEVKGRDGVKRKTAIDMPIECKGLVGKVDEYGELTHIETSSGNISRQELNEMKRSDPDNFERNLRDRGAYTGDYDTHDMFDGRGRIADHTRRNGKPKITYNGEDSFKNALNREIAKRDPNRSAGDSRQNMVQHGPQANFRGYLRATGKEEAKREQFGNEKFERILKPDVSRDPPKPLLHFDKNGEVYKIETEEDLENLYKCKGATKPSHWS